MAGLKADNELRLRTFSSVIILLIIIGSIHAGGLIWKVVASLIAVISLAEYYNLIGRIEGRRLSPGIGYIFSLIFLIAATREYPQPIILAMILTLCVFSTLVIEIFRKQMSRGAASYAIINTGGVISGVLYIALPWTCMIMLREYMLGREILFTLFMCTWGCDVAAYIGGKLFGTTKLCVHVS
ncbi:MAG: phosphatidate cytidylyltransferase, partial [Synergistaceae bacterium]|nr:phosphatidate cytidylyltransferase [Synergistaceae bacterium]